MDLDFTKMPRFMKESFKVWQLIPQWCHAYQVPEDVIIAQIYIAHAWCDSNPKKAPKKLIGRFLTSWMAAAKRYGNLKMPSVPVVPPSTKDANFAEDMTVDEMIAIRKANMERGRHG